MSAWDRFVYGALAGGFGALLGAVAALMIAFGADAHAAGWSIIEFSALYFFAVGWVRGADGGFFVAEALSALRAVGAAGLDRIPRDEPESETAARWSSVCLLGAWLAVVATLAWMAPG